MHANALIDYETPPPPAPPTKFQTHCHLMILFCRKLGHYIVHCMLFLLLNYSITRISIYALSVFYNVVTRYINNDYYYTIRFFRQCILYYVE